MLVGLVTPVSAYRVTNHLVARRQDERPSDALLNVPIITSIHLDTSHMNRCVNIYPVASINIAISFIYLQYSNDSLY